MLKLQNTLFVLLILFALSGCSSEERLNVFNIVRDDTKETIGKLKIREEDVCWESADANEPPLCWSSTDNASATAVGPNRTVRQFAEDIRILVNEYHGKLIISGTISHIDSGYMNISTGDATAYFRINSNSNLNKYELWAKYEFPVVINNMRFGNGVINIESQLLEDDSNIDRKISVADAVSSLRSFSDKYSIPTIWDIEVGEITAFDRFWAKTYGILNYLGVRIKGNDADIENLNFTEHETYQRTMWITGGGVDLVTSFAQFDADLIPSDDLPAVVRNDTKEQVDDLPATAVGPNRTVRQFAEDIRILVNEYHGKLIISGTISHIDSGYMNISTGDATAYFRINSNSNLNKYELWAKYEFPVVINNMRFGNGVINIESQLLEDDSNIDRKISVADAVSSLRSFSDKYSIPTIWDIEVGEITAFDRFWAKTYGILNYLGVRIKGNDADIENLNFTEHETYQRTMWITGGGVDLVTSFAQFDADLIP